MIQTIAIALLLASGLAEQKTSYIGVQMAQNDEKVVHIQIAIAGGPAEKAGLKPGDVLVKINDIKPADIQAAVKVIQSLKPGKKVKFLIKREGKDKEIEVTPIARDD
jgi:C-terminal processing protease CtpA/Prc